MLGHPEPSRGTISQKNKGARRGATRASHEMGSDSKMAPKSSSLEFSGTKNSATCTDFDVKRPWAKPFQGREAVGLPLPHPSSWCPWGHQGQFLPLSSWLGSKSSINHPSFLGSAGLGCPVKGRGRTGQERCVNICPPGRDLEAGSWATQQGTWLLSLSCLLQ